MLTHQLAQTERSMKCSGSDRIRQPLSLASSERGREALKDNVLLRTAKRSLGLRPPWLAEGQLILREQVPWLSAATAESQPPEIPSLLFLSVQL